MKYTKDITKKDKVLETYNAAKLVFDAVPDSKKTTDANGLCSILVNDLICGVDCYVQLFPDKSRRGVFIEPIKPMSVEEDEHYFALDSLPEDFRAAILNKMCENLCIKLSFEV